MFGFFRRSRDGVGYNPSPKDRDDQDLKVYQQDAEKYSKVKENIEKCINESMKGEREQHALARQPECSSVLHPAPGVLLCPSEGTFCPPIISRQLC